MDGTSLKKMMSDAKLNIESFWSNLNITSSDVVQFISCFGIGFLIGLFFKRYIKYFVMLVIAAVLLLAILQYFNIININHEQIKILLGFSQTATFESIMQTVLIGIRKHAIQVGCGILGYLLGFKVG